ncbi:hypothetical protein VNO80_26636 [Phaseolus coccineus]|uniref:Uncharacterized protein n=1 Tax=Phaseolus coccineus TaxID=3886 RepID=A0AAN9LF43_PHACN
METNKNQIIPTSTLYLLPELLAQAKQNNKNSEKGKWEFNFESRDSKGSHNALLFSLGSVGSVFCRLVRNKATNRETPRRGILRAPLSLNPVKVLRPFNWFLLVLYVRYKSFMVFGYPLGSIVSLRYPL